MIKTSRSNYKLSNEIKSNAEHQNKSIKEINKNRNISNKFRKKISPSKNMINQTIIPQKGEEFTEKELYHQFQVANSGGIRPSRKNKVIILINSFFSEKQGAYEDEIDKNSEFLYYVGEGEGDQKMVRKNKSIFESKQNGYTLLYFDKPEQNRLFYRFQAEYDSWELDRQSNSLGKNRKVIMFKLKIIDSI